MRISDWSSDVCSSDLRPGKFLLLGSASPDLIRNASDSLAGRIGYLQLPPFMLSEVDNNIQQLWLRGGFPLAYLAISQRASVLWRRNFIQTYINRDLGLLGLQADPQRSEEHTSELQSLMRISYAVLCLKKKKNRNTIHTT